MTYRTVLLLLALCVGFTRIAFADEETEARKEALFKAIQLPQIADMARKAGINPEELKEALNAAKEKKLPAKEMEAVLDAGVQASDEHGPIDNFGAFVQSKLNEGLRGRNLANAIRQEHAARGKGKGHNKDKGKLDRMEHGKPDKADKADKADKPNKPGKGKSDKADRAKGKQSKAKSENNDK